MLRLRRIIVMLLVTTLLANTVISFTCVSASENSFQSELTKKYSDIEIANKTEVRWWLAQGLHTDETLLEEIQAIYDAGFRGVEICQLTDPGNIDESKYAYGSEEWDHDLKLIMNKALDLGLTVSITSGTGWSTANVPGLDPDSQAANQSIFYLTETVKAGASRKGAIPTDTNLRSNAKFIGAYAYRKTTGTTFAKDFLPMQTRENASDPEEFTIEGDFIIDKEATAICFGTRNSSKSVWLQINPIYKSGKTYARCFVRGSKNTTTDIDVTSAIGYAGTNIYGKQIHIKIHVKDMTVKVYFGNSDTVAATFTIPSTAAMAANGKFTLGKLMFRQSTSYSYGSNEVARWDNLIVKDGNGNTVFEEDFSDPADTGFESLGLEVVDGMAQVGYFQQPTLGGDKVRKDFYHLQTRENAADPENFVIEGDFKIKSQSTGICFGVRDKKNYVYMQINAVNSSYGAVLLRPHVFNAGALKDRKEIDISNAIGYTASEIIGKTIHIKIAVENGIIKTYFNNSTEPVYTYSVPDTAAFNSEGKFTLGKLMFRHVTNDNYSLEEIALWDNLKVTDENGNVIFEETFDDDDSGFETGDGICVENGTLNLGKKQTVGGGDTIFVADEFINLTDMVENGTLNWTAPYYGDYMIMYYWQQGTAQRVYPAAEPTYCINYFDSRGFESLKTYFEENVLNDAALNEKIKKGDVQMFMDSLEYTNGKGFTMWPETFAGEFKSRKGYDVTPYMYLAIGAPTTSIWNWSDNADLIGTYTLTDSELNHKILNDIYDVQTQLYMEKFMTPFREWLNSYGIKLRAQISYGKNLEISKPISVVDYPEAENRNQRNQIDMYRLWSGGAHLQNKVLSSETGGLENSAYTYDYQRHLQESYTLFASGYNRIIWHIWTSSYGSSATTWPGYEGGRSQYYKFGTREPSYTEYNEFNEHLGRIQTLLREGKSGTDIGLLYTKYGQHLVYSNKEDWMKKHKTLFFPSTKLQDNGYTYDYLNPDMLTADGVYFDKDTQTLELAGYKAIVVWQEELDVNGAKALLNYAEQGLKVIIVDGAAVKSPYNDNTESELKTIISDLKSLANVKTASNADDVLNALKEMKVVPYVAFESENQQLLSQTRRDGENRYVYLYNYCDGSLHTVSNKTHGDTISTSIIMDGTFIPYYIDAWSGKVEKVEKYTHTDGKTVIPVSLDYGDVALYAFEKTDLPVLREKESEKTILTDKSFEIDSWSLTVESWTEGETITRTDGRSTEYSVSTKKENITVNLDTLATWDNISEIGKEVSGKGYYKSTFNWDGEFDGAFIDFGKIVQSMKVYVNG
ncbi:MAG: hypothetical protein IJZ90_01250, partial [Clostridia bacterium]|nr:hypothetical protein [Clostridia bacterium]